MGEIWLPLGMAATFGAFTGSLFRLNRRPGSDRPFLFPLVGMAAGVTAFFVFSVLTWLVNVPDWLLPVLVILQAWLWLGPLGPKFKRGNKFGTGGSENGRG